MKLYIYQHCPFCARVRFVAGLLGLSLDIQVVDYDDAKTTTDIIGSKQVPLLVKDNGEATAESLDIIDYFISLEGSEEINKPSETVKAWQSSAFLPLQKVGYPRWSLMGLKEFSSDSSKKAWREKKETEALNFDKLICDTPVIAEEVAALTVKAAKILDSNAEKLTLVDRAIIFSILRGFFSAPEINWEPSVKTWMESMSEKSKVELLK